MKNTFKDMNGTEYRKLTVRRVGRRRRRSFMVLDRERNIFIDIEFPTREEAWTWIVTKGGKAA